ncbi:MAG: A/G-specific adenine glycosylase [Candidatus Aminicenantes bacterium]
MAENSVGRSSDFQTKLFRWYRLHQRKLPWRQTKDPYRIWISEIMLQQTTVQAVVPYYQKWIKLFPDVKTLSKASLQKVLKAWEGLGYYQRAKNLHRAAKIILHRFEGKIPKDYHSLKELPGIGPYTASALLSFAYNLPYPVVDANVRRVLMRLLGIRDKNLSPSNKAFQKFFHAHFPPTHSSLFNQALMELGALVCRSKNPLCLLCPITEYCQAYEAGEQEVIPLPQKRSYQKIETVVAIIQNHGKILIQKRPSQGLLADLWEFPGGKRKDHETPEQALRREIKEELGAEVKNLSFLTKVHHSYTKFQVTLYAFRCALETTPHLRKSTHRWVTAKGLKRYPFPSGSVKIIRFLEEKRHYASPQ